MGRSRARACSSRGACSAPRSRARACTRRCTRDARAPTPGTSPGTSPGWGTLPRRAATRTAATSTAAGTSRRRTCPRARGGTAGTALSTPGTAAAAPGGGAGGTAAISTAWKGEGLEGLDTGTAGLSQTPRRRAANRVALGLRLTRIARRTRSRTPRILKRSRPRRTTWTRTSRIARRRGRDHESRITKCPAKRRAVAPGIARGRARGRRRAAGRPFPCRTTQRTRPPRSRRVRPRGRASTSPGCRGTCRAAAPRE